MLLPIFKTIQNTNPQKAKEGLLANALACDRGYFVVFDARVFFQNSQIKQMTSKCNSDGTSATKLFTYHKPKWP